MSKAGGYIYAIGVEGQPWVKIGCTKGSVEHRMAQLQTGQPLRLSVIASRAIEANLREVEKYIHRFLAEKKHCGEWFDTPIDEAMLQSLVLEALAYVAENISESDDTEQQVGNPVLGANLVKLRAQRRMNQKKLCAETKLAQRFISGIEHNHIDPRLSVLCTIAKALGVSVSVLLDGVKDVEIEHKPTGRDEV